MRGVLVLALIAGCADDGALDPHEIVDCPSDEGYRCELACADAPASDSPLCVIDGTQTCAPLAVHVFGEIAGCCLPQTGIGDAMRIAWVECQ